MRWRPLRDLRHPWSQSDGGYHRPAQSWQPLQLQGPVLAVADLSAEVLQPMLRAGHVNVTAYRKLRWSGRTGLLLEAA